MAAEDGAEASEVAAVPEVPDTIGVLIEEAEVGREAEGAWGKCQPDRAHTRSASRGSKVRGAAWNVDAFFCHPSFQSRLLLSLSVVNACGGGPLLVFPGGGGY